jgi:Tfp pilus assembly protein PilZ
MRDYTPLSMETFNQVEELYEAIQLRRRFERDAAEGLNSDPRCVDELNRYISTMKEHGFGCFDVLERATAEDGDVCTGLQVTWETPSDLWRAVTWNINKDGVFIQTDDFLTIDSKLDLAIVIKKPRVVMKYESKVIWTNPKARTGRPVGMGLKILWKSEDDRNLFKGFLAGDVPAVELNSLQ